MSKLCVKRIKELIIHKLSSKLIEYDADKMVDELTDSGKLYKAQRDKLTNVLLKKPLSQEQYHGFEKALAYKSAFNKLQKWADPDFCDMADKMQGGLIQALSSDRPIWDILLDMICEDNLCHLKGAVIEFIDRKQLWIMFEELLFDESYYINYDNDNPLILDCGVNIGLAIYYFKHQRPNARIVGFEPWSVAWECAMRNVERNKWTDVTIHRAALSNTDGQTIMTIISDNSTAATLTNRMDDYLANRSLTPITEAIPTVRLAPYISEAVDFLKIDIEGMEQLVLEDCGEALKNVKWIFVEYHFSDKIESNKLDQIVSLLAKTGFMLEIGLSVAYSKAVVKRPFLHVGKNVSMILFGKQIACQTEKKGSGLNG
ncbi:MAG: FkbM family methyltransferase [Raoultibacter sp.]